jgi:hypothetical protein
MSGGGGGGDTADKVMPNVTSKIQADAEAELRRGLRAAGAGR